MPGKKRETPATTRNMPRLKFKTPIKRMAKHMNTKKVHWDAMEIPEGVIEYIVDRLTKNALDMMPSKAVVITQSIMRDAALSMLVNADSETRKRVLDAGTRAVQKVKESQAE